MDWPLVIVTPVGPLTIDLACGPVALGPPDREMTLASGAYVAQWDDHEGLASDMLLTQYDDQAPVLENQPVPECWGVEWRLHAPRRPTPPMSVLVLVPDGLDTSGTRDEGLAATEIWTDAWRLCVAGPDEVWFARQIEARASAPSWARVFGDDDSLGVGGFGPWSTERGIVWHLPGLDQGESATSWVAAAWCAAGTPGADDAAFCAVDVDPSLLREAAELRGPVADLRAEPFS